MKTTIGNWASYIRVKEIEENEKVSYTKELCKDVYIDYDVDHNVLGIEILSELKPEYYPDYKEKK